MTSGLSVAIIGSGPSGLYAAEELTRAGATRVDVFDRVPAPFGLVRYGVAPDHAKIKSIIRTLARIFDNDVVRFFGNVEVGRDIFLSDLVACYDAVIHASGASLDRRLGIPGEDLRGSFSGTEFVSWYSGHPDVDIDRFALTARSAVIIGAGNVAVDVARILGKSAEDLAWTDLPDHVLTVLRASRIQQIHVLARRGVAHAKFTLKELRELGEIAGVDVLVDPADLSLDDAGAAAVAASPALRRNVDVLSEWAARTPQGRERRLHLRFWTRPEAITGLNEVAEVHVRRTELIDGRVYDTEHREVIPAQLVLRTVGYRGVPTAGLPFNADSGTIPNSGGRVVGAGGRPIPGQYVTGWIKRGPRGVIGTNRSDSKETVALLLADHAARSTPSRDPAAIESLFAERGLTVVGWTGWHHIDEAEIALGAIQNRDRVKIADRAAMLKHSRR